MPNANESGARGYMQTTPLKIGKISKKHLTPCRRVGLCRSIKKTPMITSTPSLIISSTQSSPINNVDLAVVNPVLNESKHLITPNKEVVIRLPRVKKNLKLETGTPKCKKSNELDINESQVCEATTDVNNCNDISNFKHGEILSNIDQLNLAAKVHNTSHSAQIIKKATKNTTAKKHFTKVLSMKRLSSSSELSDLEDPLFTDISPVLTSPTTLDNFPNVESDEENFDIKVVANKSSKRKVICSSDEDDFVSSQNSFKGNCKEMEKKNAEIKQRIQIKTAQLEKLQQSAVYKKLHNVEKLHETTEIWKKGCHDALRYLLVKLQCHGPMSIPTLLLNLKIPKELVDYNVDNDSFL